MENIFEESSVQYPKTLKLKIRRKKRRTGIATHVFFFWPAYNIFKLEGRKGRKEGRSLNRSDSN